MSGLPRLVQRAPALLYAAAVFYLIASVVIVHFQMADSVRGAGSSMDAFVRLGLLSAWLQAAEGALYIAATGAMIHVLLAIWRNGRERASGGQE